jgi:hypothetical protein
LSPALYRLELTDDPSHAAGLGGWSGAHFALRADASGGGGEVAAGTLAVGQVSKVLFVCLATGCFEATLFAR